MARGLTSLLQLIATSAEATTATSATLPALDILDGPRFAWRGLTVDVVRRFFPPAQIRTLIDLAALYKLDVLHLHLTDDQGWRIEAGRPAPLREPDGSFYTNDELRALISYAADRFVTLLPEVGDYVRHLKHAVRALGKRSVGWQESIRAGADPGHVIQYWMDASSLGAGAELPPSPEVTARVRANYLRGRADIEQALAHGVPVIVSPQAYCYFDVPYAEAAADPGQRERRDQVGLRHYARRTLEATFDWDPATTVGVDHVAGVGAALWCETVRDADDLTFLLLPRLAGTAEKAWGPAGAVTWPEHRDALAQHTRLWEQDGLTFFSAA